MPQLACAVETQAQTQTHAASVVERRTARAGMGPGLAGQVLAGRPEQAAPASAGHARRPQQHQGVHRLCKFIRVLRRLVPPWDVRMRPTWGAGGAARARTPPADPPRPQPPCPGIKRARRRAAWARLLTAIRSPSHRLSACLRFALLLWALGGPSEPLAALFARRRDSLAVELRASPPAARYQLRRGSPPSPDLNETDPR